MRKEIELETKLAWWFLDIYLPIVSWLRRDFDLTPNAERVNYWANKALKTKVLKNA